MCLVSRLVSPEKQDKDGRDKSREECVTEAREAKEGLKEEELSRNEQLEETLEVRWKMEKDGESKEENDEKEEKEVKDEQERWRKKRGSRRLRRKFRKGKRRK